MTHSSFRLARLVLPVLVLAVAAPAAQPLTPRPIAITGVTVIDAPVLANGRLELRWYLREQTVSRVLHRYGSVTEPDA